MAILVLNLLSALGLCFTPFSHQPPLSSNKWHQYPDNTSFMTDKMAFLPLSLALKTTLTQVCCWHDGSFRSTLIDTNCFMDNREYKPHASTHARLWLPTHTRTYDGFHSRHDIICFCDHYKVQVTYTEATERWGAAITQIKPFSEILFQCFIVN